MKLFTIIIIFFLLISDVITASANEEESSEITNTINKLENYKNNDTNKVNLINEIISYYSGTDPEKGVNYAKQGIELSKKLNHKYGLVAIYTNVGNCYYVMSDLINADKYFHLALDISTKSGFKKETANLYTNIGYLFFGQADYQKSIEKFLKALQIFEEIKDENGAATNFGNIGTIYMIQKEFNKALDCFGKSLKLALKTKSKELISNSYGNLGNAYFEINDYTKSLEFYTKSLKLSREMNNLFTESNSLSNIGMIYLNTKNFRSAFENFFAAIKIQEQIQNQSGLMISYGNLGVLLLKSADNPIKDNNDLINLKIVQKSDYINKSIEYSMKAVELATMLNAKKEMIEWYDNLAKANKLLKKWDEAYQYLESSNLLKDSIFSQENKNKIAKLEAKREKDLLVKQNEFQKFQITFYIICLILLIVIAIVLMLSFRKSRNANKLLNQKNQLIEKSNSELEVQNQFISEAKIELEQLNEDLMNREKQLSELNATKDKFFSIIAHDLKNPLTALITGSELLFSYYDRFDDSNRLKHIGKLSESSKFLLKLLDNLLQWARSQTGRIEFNPQENSLDTTIREVAELNRLNFASKNINFKFNSQKDDLLIFDKNMLHTILRNLISNAVKFSNDGGTVTISKSYKPHIIEISVTDCGTGISKTNLENLFKLDKSITTLGTNNEKGTGLGLILCKEFIEKHNGKIEVESEEGIGTSFTISLPFNLNK